jgi:hypothetical protein
MNNYKYRFKTEKEFIEEYGVYWRRIVGWNYNGLMDHFLGNDFEVNVNDLNDRQIFNMFDSFYNQYYCPNYNMGKNQPHKWNIFKNMLKRKVNYEPKKLCYE